MQFLRVGNVTGATLIGSPFLAVPWRSALSLLHDCSFMVSFLQRFRRLLLSSLLAASCAGACVTVDRSAENGVGPEQFKDGGLDRFIVDAAANPPDGSAMPDAASMSMLCGVGDCGDDMLPDDANACVNFDAGSLAPSSGGLGGSGGITDGFVGEIDAGSDAHAMLDGGKNYGSGGAASFNGPDAYVFAPTPASLEPLDATIVSSASSLDIDAHVAATDADAGPVPEPVYACHVRRGETGPIHRCEVAGAGQQGAPCTSSRDCAPGFGCVDDEGAAKCLHFCCGGGTSSDDGGSGCEHDTYCAERPLRDDTSNNPLMVPVCTPADNCSLDDPYPCTIDSCTCPEGEACAIVRNDGTTSCVVPGNGLAGEACPCAPGFFCSFATNTCVKICRTDGSDDMACGTGRCQATVNLPEGYGLCVATTEGR